MNAEFVYQIISRISSLHETIHGTTDNIILLYFNLYMVLRYVHQNDIHDLECCFFNMIIILRRCKYVTGECVTVYKILEKTVLNVGRNGLHQNGLVL